MSPKQILHTIQGLNRSRWICLSVLMIIVFCSAPSSAELKSMTQDELKTSTAQAGFTDFTLSGDTARLFLDIHIETSANIGGFTAGTYQQWNTIGIGSSSNPLVIDGLVFIADFATNTVGVSGVEPVLERIVVGSNRLQGTISANFNIFSGIFNGDLVSGGSPVSGVELKGYTGLGNVSFNFNSNTNANGDMGFFFVINASENNVGIQVVAGYNESNIPNTSQGKWWDSP